MKKLCAKPITYQILKYKLGKTKAKFQVFCVNWRKMQGAQKSSTFKVAAAIYILFLSKSGI